MNAIHRRMVMSLGIISILSILVAGCALLPRTPYGATEASSVRVLDLA